MLAPLFGRTSPPLAVSDSDDSLQASESASQLKEQKQEASLSLKLGEKDVHETGSGNSEDEWEDVNS